MHCEHCGTKLKEGSKFCQSCGKKASEAVKGDTERTVEPSTADIGTEAVVKCGNCGYVGPGEPARSIWAKVLAWIFVVFAPLITIIYFVATSKYRCPKCKSTFLGVKNKEGVFAGQRGGAKRPIMIVVWVVVGIAVVGILATLLLLQLGVARERARDAKRIADVSQLRTAVELYYDDNGGQYPTALDTVSLGKYVEEIPVDPLTDESYGYLFGPIDEPTAYVVYAELEQKTAALDKDSDIKSGDFDGGQEACTEAPDDCVYDLGYIPN